MPRELLAIADELRAIAATGLHYTEGEFDRERYRRLLELATRLGRRAAPSHAEDIALLLTHADRGYVTPKVDVRLAVFRGPAVLLVRERSDDRWALPGGYADVGDSPSDAARRETAEEAGVDAKVIRLAGVYDTRLQPDAPPHPFHIYKLVFAGELTCADATPHPGHETSAAAFHALDALPDLSRGRTSPRHIEAARAVLEDASLAPHFD